MRAEDRATARRKLDQRLGALGNAQAQTPPRGWIKAIREALGMTTAQLAARLGVSQPRVVAIEKAEAKKAITLDSLERAAQALDCRLVYTLVPRKPLEELAEDRAKAEARKRLQSTSHSMALEAQSVTGADEEEQLKRLTKRLLEKAGSDLWEDDE
ncbi:MULTISPECIES: mobile mystery protein A [unclassified Thioalkalivibrio]|uniref:mobile mystery protein A n=1 Tax=unclassified Thioalkalivibrio TaxID=2621013 RepID=UPI0004782131|nr:MULTISPECIES: mobile mystery protein A [unclassified Thioalkalivibrio]